MGYVACLGQRPEETAHVLQNLVSANGLKAHENVIRHVGGIDLLSLTDLGCVLLFYRVQSALKVTILHQYAYFFYNKHVLRVE